MAGLGFSDSKNQMNSILLSHYGVELNQPQGISQPPAVRPNQERPAARQQPAPPPKQPPPRAKQSELNRLMQNISRETYSVVTCEDLRNRLNPIASANPEKWVELEKLAEEAARALDAIKDITVNDIIKVNNSDCEKLFEVAADKQLELANAMRELAVDQKVCGKPKLDRYRQLLDDLSLKCDSRGSEILTLYMEVKTVGKEQMIGAKSSFRTAKTADLMKGMAGSMHGNDKSVLLEEQVKALEEQLAKMSAEPTVALEEINQLQEKANALSSELKSDAVSQTMDADIFEKLTEHLDRLESRMDEYVARAVKKAAANTFRQCGSINETGRAFVNFISERKEEFPKLNALMSDLDKLTAGDWESVEAKDLDEVEEILNKKTDELKSEIQKYCNLSPTARAPHIGGLWNRMDLNTLLTGVGYSGSKPILMAARVAKEMDNRHRGWAKEAKVRQQLGGEDVVNVFRHDSNPSLSMVVETRINGANKKNVDFHLCDKNIQGKARPAGAGLWNKVVKLTYIMPDGNPKDFVFKPDLSGRCSLNNLTLGLFKSYRPAQQVVKLNTATCDTAELLGVGYLTGKNYVTVHRGQYGLLMEKAPGKVAAEIPVDQEHKDLFCQKNLKVCGSLAKQLNDLAWLDLATGQGDRHGDNYMVNFAGPGKKPKVTAIDNDMCFNTYLVGIGKFKLNHDNGDDPEKSQRFCNFRNCLRYYCNNNEKKINKLLQKIADNDYVVDTRKASKEEICALFMAFGHHAPTLPKQMSRSMCEKLKALTDEAIDKFAKGLAKNVSSKNAIQAAKARLKELKEIAEEYEQNGRVVEDKDWTTKVEFIENELDYNANLKTMPKVPKENPESFDSPEEILPHCMASSLLMRDFDEMFD